MAMRSKSSTSIQSRSLIAIAIEDRIDLWFHNDPSTGIPIALEPVNIPENAPFLESLYQLLDRQLNKLVDMITRQQQTSVTNFLKSIYSIVISVPGVVRDNVTLRQISIWNLQYDKEITTQNKSLRWTINGQARDWFNFCEVLISIIKSIVTRAGEKWSDSLHEICKHLIYVVNDATACAAFEYTKLKESHREKKFVYVKAHNGINVGVVEYALKEDSKDKAFVARPSHAEAGHTFPLLHPLDFKSNYRGSCIYHGWCLEGLVSTHSFYQRAMQNNSSFPEWRRWLRENEADFRSNQERDSKLTRYILGDVLDDEHETEITPPAGNGDGAHLIAHYISQLVYQVALGPFSPELIVIGGRLAQPNVIRLIRENVLRWANGYPDRDELKAEKIHEFIVRTRASSTAKAPAKTEHTALHEKHTVEVQGALRIAASGPVPNSQCLPLDEKTPVH